MYYFCNKNKNVKQNSKDLNLGNDRKTEEIGAWGLKKGTND